MFDDSDETELRLPYYRHISFSTFWDILVAFATKAFIRPKIILSHLFTQQQQLLVRNFINLIGKNYSKTFIENQKKKKKKWLQNDSGSDYKRHNTVEFFVLFEIEVYNRKTSDKAITLQWFLDVLLRSIVISWQTRVQSIL